MTFVAVIFLNLVCFFFDLNLLATMLLCVIEQIVTVTCRRANLHRTVTHDLVLDCYPTGSGLDVIGNALLHLKDEYILLNTGSSYLLPFATSISWKEIYCGILSKVGSLLTEVYKKSFVLVQVLRMYRDALM